LSPTQLISANPAYGSLRLVGGPGPLEGTAWVIWNGQRDHIQTGEEFRCWVDPQYASVIEFDVWDQVTDDQLNHWPIATNFHVSNCGDPAHPTF
jgi:hypothetical protein